MNIKTSYDSGEWYAIDDDTYDGAIDSSTRHCVGCGVTREAAIADLEEQMRMVEEIREWKALAGDSSRS